MSETEREDIEAEYLSDENAFEQMLIAEDELVDAYARGELSDKERSQFEKNFLTSARGRDRVEFSHALVGAVADARPVTVKVAPEPSPASWVALWAAFTPRLRVAAVTLSVLLVAAFSWLLVERGRTLTELQGLRAERARLTEKSEELQRIADAERARSAELTARIEAERERSSSADNPQPTPVVQVVKNDQKRVPPPLTVRPDEFVAFNLRPGSVRGGDGTTLAVPQKANSIVLRLSFERPSLHQVYRAAIETPEGKTVWRNDSFGFRESVTALDQVSLPAIPASALPPGDYVLFLTGKRPDGNFEPLANYSFRISRK
jgi:hypothetical protein